MFIGYMSIGRNCKIMWPVSMSDKHCPEKNALILSYIFSGDLTALSKHPSCGCSCPVLISQLLFNQLVFFILFLFMKGLCALWRYCTKK